MRREKTEISKIRNSKAEITTNTREIIRDYFESLYSNKFENLLKPTLLSSQNQTKTPPKRRTIG
jgi:hypothetical protein